MGKVFDWDQEKNQKLLSDRGISFETVVAMIEEENILAVVPGAGRFAHQKQFIIAIRDYVYFVPFVENDNTVFLKTIIPSRKLTKLYLSGEL